MRKLLHLTNEFKKKIKIRQKIQFSNSDYIFEYEKSPQLFH